MKTLIAFGILIVIGFLGAVKLFNRIKTATPFSYLFYSGTVFIFFGLIIGENGFNLISREIIRHLEPIVHFSLGWVGFIFGFQLETKYFKRIQWSWYVSLIATYAATFVAVFFFTLLIVRIFSTSFVQSSDMAIGTALVLAVLIPESSVAFTVWSSRFFKNRLSQIRLCAFISSMDNIIPILLTGLLFSFYRFIPDTHQVVSNHAGDFILSFGSQILLGILCGLAIHYLSRRIKEKLEISAVFFGVIFFLSGLSMMFNFSALFVAMVTGAVFSNMTKRHTSFLKIINPTEKPIYLIFLVFLAVQKAEFSWLFVMIAFLLPVIKFISKSTIFWFLRSIDSKRFDTPTYLSYLLLPLSSLAPAIVLDLYIAFPDETTQKVAGIFIICLVILEIFAPVAIHITKKHMEAKELESKKT